MGVRRLLRALTADWTGKIAVSIVALVVLFAIGQDLLSLEEYALVDLAKRFDPPSAADPLGADLLGRSILAGVIEGTRIVLYIALVTAAISALVGYTVGMISGYVGGLLDLILMRIFDVLLAFPSILLALAIVSIAGAGLQNAIMAMIIAQIAPFARLIRGQVLAEKESLHVANARAVGVPNWRIMVRHVLPNISGPLAVQATFATGTSILGVAALGFLGLGAQPGTPDWGTMIFENQAYLSTDPHAVVIPGVAIFLVVFAFNIIGESLRELFDRRSTTTYRFW